MRMHQCEQPGSWTVRGNWQGGLGIYSGTWDTGVRELGLSSRYPDANMAPPMIQIAVADYGYRVHRWGWGCFKTLGYPP